MSHNLSVYMRGILKESVPLATLQMISLAFENMFAIDEDAQKEWRRKMFKFLTNNPTPLNMQLVALGPWYECYVNVYRVGEKKQPRHIHLFENHFDYELLEESRSSLNVETREYIFASVQRHHTHTVEFARWLFENTEQAICDNNEVGSIRLEEASRGHILILGQEFKTFAKGTLM